MNSTRRSAVAAGVFFIVAAVAAIIGLALEGAVLNDPRLYTSSLVPRVIAVFGLIGGPLIFASGTAVMFGLYQQLSVWGAIAAIPVFAWEMSLAVWLIAKGFRPSPITSGMGSGSTRVLATA